MFDWLIKIIKKIVPNWILSPALNIYHYLVSLMYFGNKFICPICRGHFRRFLPIGLDIPVIKKYNIVPGGFRKNAKCPRCRSTDRERLFYLYLIKYQPNIFEENINLLHIAPEIKLRKVFNSHSNINYINGDLYNPQADEVIDITSINYDDNVFDIIICSHVLEHIQKDELAMSELFRVLKPGGLAIIQVPISSVLVETFEDSSIIEPEDREKYFGQKDHVRIYGTDYIKRLKKSGFKVTAYDFISELNPFDVQKYALLKDEKLYLCSK